MVGEGCFVGWLAARMSGLIVMLHNRSHQAHGKPSKIRSLPWLTWQLLDIIRCFYHKLSDSVQQMPSAVMNKTSYIPDLDTESTIWRMYIISNRVKHGVYYY